MEENLKNIVEQLKSKNPKAKESIKSDLESNLSKFKETKNLFSTYFNELILAIENLPTITNEKIEESDESPAGQPSVTVWEWEYIDKSTKKFIQEGDEYILDGNGNYSNLYAYSSVAVSSDCKMQVKFNDVSSFGCGGFGIISKNDPLFEEGSWSTSNGTNPLFCLCCSGTWGAKSIGKVGGGQALQHRLKQASSDNRTLTFDFDFSEMKFKIYDPNEELFSEFDMNTMQYKEDLVLLFYTSSNIKHSHQIVYI